MATQTVEFRSPSSQTVTAKLFAVGSDTEQASVSATEATNRKGTYSAAFTDEAAGEYELIAFVGAVPVARWFVTLTLTTATFQVYDKVRAELDSDALDPVLEAIAAIELSGGGLTPTQAEHLALIPAIATAFASIEWEGTIVGVPVSFVAGADLTFSVQLLDATGSQLTTIYGIPVASATWLFGIGTERNPRSIQGTAVWGSGVLAVTIPRQQSEGKPAGQYEYQLGVLVSGSVYWIRSGAIRLRPRQFVIPTTTTAAP